MQHPRIAIFVHNLAATGVVRNALAIATQATQQDYAVDLIVWRAEGTLAGSLNPAIRLVTLDKSGIASGRETELIRALPPLRRYLKKERPALILSAGNHGHLLVWAALRGLRPIKRIYRISNELARPDEKGTLKSRLRHATARLLLRDADRIVTVSARLRDVMGDNPKIAVISNGVAVEMVRAAALKPCDHPWLQAGQPPVMLGIGRFVRQKNWSGLLQALAIVNRSTPLRLILLGDGSDAARAELEAEISALGLGDKVILPGTVANPFAWLARARLFALPSFWEGSPNVLLEAMACDIPVVASWSAGNATEILDGGRYGLLVDPEDIDNIAHAILAQYDPATRILPHQRAGAFDLSVTLARYMQLFGDLLRR